MWEFQACTHTHTHTCTHTFVFTRSVYGQLVTAGGACTSSLVSISVSGAILNAYRYWGEIIHVLDSVWCGIWESYSVLFVRVSNLGESYESCDMLLLALQYFMIPVYLYVRSPHIQRYTCTYAEQLGIHGANEGQPAQNSCQPFALCTPFYFHAYTVEPSNKTPEMRTHRHLLLLYIGHPEIMMCLLHVVYCYSFKVINLRTPSVPLVSIQRGVTVSLPSYL